MPLDLLISGARIIDPAQKIDLTGDLLISDGRISEIFSSPVNPGKNVMIMKAQGCIVCPGFIDLHCHLREPGFEEKETIATGTRAAARGGFTTVCCMPNTNPPLDNEASINYIKRKSETDAVIRVLPIGCITKGRQGKELTEMNELADAGVVGFSDDGNPVSSSRIMYLAMQYSKSSGLPLIDHCEDRELAENGVMNEGWVATRLGLKGIPSAAEEIMVARDIFLANLTGARLHIAHVSTKGSVELIKRAKKDGVNITAEVSPNHLLLTEERVLKDSLDKNLAYDTDAKVNPPLRTEEDINALIEGLKDGIIDAIATDHAPHTQVDKLCEFGFAAFGISSFETAFSSLVSLIHKKLLDYNTLISAMANQPAAIIGNRFGELGILKPGNKADVVIFNPEIEWVVDKNTFISKGKNTPFNGKKLKGKIIATISDGEFAFQAIPK